MRIRKSLIATAVLGALGFSGQAWSQQDESGRGDNNSTYSEDNSGNNRDNLGVAVALGLGNAAADNNSTATTNVADSFNSSSAVATTNLIGVVSGNSVYDIGNTSRNSGNANGGDGGDGGLAVGGFAFGGAGEGGDGGDGGDAGAMSARGGDSGAGSLDRESVVWGQDWCGRVKIGGC